MKNVVGHLLEENVILGQNVSIRTLPILSVASKDVQASH
ncbi:SufD family Fe-S cluster assembly protein [Patescibacteria group bacterium]|nr:SufD family Fe-S cluster assembly protein [Patescibacteria group bacterium]MBU1757688.1 SufD family Fe-S cluster assembly protein [Patescibacteria group bacterium]